MGEMIGVSHLELRAKQDKHWRALVETFSKLLLRYPQQDVKQAFDLALARKEAKLKASVK